MHHIKGTAMGTIFAAVGSNLTVAYFEVKIFALLRHIYPNNFLVFTFFYYEYFTSFIGIIYTYIYIYIYHICFFQVKSQTGNHVVAE